MARKTPERNAAEFSKLVETLKDFVIIVEGKRDRWALKTLGLYNVIAINGRPLIKVVYQIKELKRTPVILTDFDKTGRKIARKLNSLLQAYEIHPNSKLRRKVMEYGKNKIEDFRNFGTEGSLQKESEYYVKTGSYFNKIHNKSAYKSKRNSRKTRCYRRDIRPD